MSDESIYQRLDEQERIYAPEQLPEGDPKHARAEAEEGRDVRQGAADPPAPAPVANVGSGPSGLAAPPNIGHRDHGGAPGDPETDARYPIGPDEARERH